MYVGEAFGLSLKGRIQKYVLVLTFMRVCYHVM